MRKQKNPKTKRKEKLVHLERRVRVTFFLPVEYKEEQYAVKEVVRFLESQYPTGPITKLTVTGFTYSAIHGTTLEKDYIFTGSWWSDVKIRGVSAKELTTESVVLFIIDFPAVIEEWKLDQNIIRLKEVIFSAYAERGSPQKEIWIVKQDIYRYA